MPEDAERNPFASFTVNADGTCIVDGEQGSWRIRQEWVSDDSLPLDFFLGDTMVGGIAVNRGSEVLTAYLPDGGACPGSWVRMDNIITVEITLENWTEYFELAETEEYVTDDFGDFQYVSREWLLRLKPQYAPMAYKRYELQFEVRYTSAEVSYELDHDNQTARLFGEPQNIRETTEKMRMYLGVEQFTRLASTGMGEGYATTTVHSDFQILRFAGDTILQLEKLEEEIAENSEPAPEVLQPVAGSAAEETDRKPEVPGKLQGLWVSTGVEGLLTLYGFQDNSIDTYVVNMGAGASNMLSGTYTVEDDRLSYDFGNSTGYTSYTYDGEVLTLVDASGTTLVRLTDADVMNYLAQEETSGNSAGVMLLADLVVKYFPDSDQAAAATEKKDASLAAIKQEGEAALSTLRTTYDKVQKLTWYQSKSEPQYADVCCYIYPYIGRLDDGTTWLRVVLNYTDAQTNAGWIFFNNVIFSVDGENTTKVFNRNEITRDNDTEVWEIADFEPSASEIALLRSIAASNETIIRFQGDSYYYDHVVTAKEKTAINDVLAAYNYLANYYE